MRVLLRGGLRAAEEADVVGVVDMDAVGEGVEISDISGPISSVRMLATVSSKGPISSLATFQDRSMRFEAMR